MNILQYIAQMIVRLVNSAHGFLPFRVRARAVPEAQRALSTRSTAPILIAGALMRQFIPMCRLCGTRCIIHMEPAGRCRLCLLERAPLVRSLYQRNSDMLSPLILMARGYAAGLGNPGAQYKDTRHNVRLPSQHTQHLRLNC
jgi:hypothetical protein